MATAPQHTNAHPQEGGTLLRPAIWRPADRHLRLGVSHPSNDPAQHRTFEIRALYDAARKGWVASVGEQNLNDQRGAWSSVMGDGQHAVFPTAAACLGHAVETIVTAFDRDVDAG
jgi:hypothetical protein